MRGRPLILPQNQCPALFAASSSSEDVDKTASLCVHPYGYSRQAPFLLTLGAGTKTPRLHWHSDTTRPCRSKRQKIYSKTV